MSSQREFARKINSRGEAARLRVSASVASKKEILNSPRSVEPLDYENFVDSKTATLFNDLQKDLVLFPADDIDGKKIPRLSKSINSGIPENTFAQPATQLVKQCLKFYASDWQVVTYKYSKWGCGYETFVHRFNESRSKLPLQRFEVDEIDDKSFTADLNLKIVKKGWLQLAKQDLAEVQGVSSLQSGKFFRRYFFQLRENVDCTYVLEYSLDERRTAGAPESFYLDSCQNVSSKKMWQRHIIDLVMKDNGHRWLSAESEEEQVSWIEALRSALDYQHRRDIHSSGNQMKHFKPASAPSGFAESVENLTALLQRYSSESESFIDSNRNRERQHLISVYPELQSAKKRVNGTSCVSPSSSANYVVCSTDDPDIKPFCGQLESCRRFLVTCERFQTELQCNVVGNRLHNPEPFFISLCLIDARAGRKLTEDFLWNPNLPDIESMLPMERADLCEAHPDEPLVAGGYIERYLHSCRSCIFSVTEVHAEIYLVVRVEKVLQGSISHCADKYIKHGDVKVGNQQNKTMRALCANIGQYRMPFGWAARPLLLNAESSMSFELYRHESSKLTEEDLIKHVKDLAQHNGDRNSKLQRIPINLIIQVQDVKEDALLENVVSSTLLPLKPFSEENRTIVREIDLFPHEGVGAEQFISPSLTYQNLLYVYPRELDYSNLPRNFTRARNLCVFVELKDNDEGEMSKPFKCVFARPRSDVSVLTSYSNSCVSHHDETPRFYDEIKLLLPSHLTAKHHLLFTFYHVGVDAAASLDRDKNRRLETRVGYSWLRLLSPTREVRTRSFKCRIALNLPLGYLSVDNDVRSLPTPGAPEIKWVDATKSQFNVVLRLSSSIYTSTDKLSSFFHQCGVLEIGDRGRSIPDCAKAASDPEIARTLNCLKGILAVELPTIIQFLPPLLNQLLQLLTMNQSVIIQEKALMVMVNLLACLTQSGQAYNLSSEVVQRNHCLLKTYVKFAFALDIIVPNWSRTVHEQLTVSVRMFLTATHHNQLDVQRLLHNIWFLLELIAKSMAQFLLATGKLKIKRKARFPDEYQNEIILLIDKLGEQVIAKSRRKETQNQAEKANISTAVFLRRLFSLMNRGFVLTLVRIYMDHFLTSETVIQLRCKFEFLRVLCNYEHFVPLNLPTQSHQLSKAEEIDVRSEFSLSERFCQQHFLVGCLLENISCALFEAPELRKLAIRVLRDLLAKHALDDRYQKKQCQSRIVSLYIPFLGIMIEQKPRFRQPADPELEAAVYKKRQDVAKSDILGSVGGSDSGSLFSATLHKSNGDLHSSGSSRHSSHLVTGGTVGAKGSRSSGSVVSAPVSGSRVVSSSAVNGRLSLPRPPSTHVAKAADPTLLNAIAGLDSGGALAKYTRDKGLSKDGSVSEISVASTLSAVSFGALSSATNESGGSDGTIGPIDEEIAADMDLDMDSVSKRSSMSKCPKHLDHLTESFKLNEQRDLLLCLLFIVSAVENEILLAWFKSLSPNDRVDFFQLLELSLQTFKYRGRQKTMTFESISHTGYPGSSLSARQARTLATKLQRPAATSSVNHANSDDGKNASLDNDHDVMQRSIIDGNLSTEVGLIVLDVLCIYIHNFRGDLICTDLENPVFRQLFEVFLTFLRTPQSEVLLRHCFASLRIFVSRFSSVLFGGRSSAASCSQLCYEVLRGCNAKVTSSRTEACGLLYLMMKNNWEYSGRTKFTRVQLQIIVATSKLVTTDSLNSPNFQDSLAMLNNLARADRTVRGVFEDQVNDLTSTIRRILAANAHIDRYRFDPEMRIDLLYQLAKNYKNTPRLRLTYMDNMCRIHLEGHKDYYDNARDLSEAAFCYIHSAALIAQYLRLKNVYSKGCAGFSRISPNVEREESEIIDDSGYEEEGFTESEIIWRLEKAMEIMEEAERFECVPDICRLILPYYEEQRDYAHLAQLYDKNRRCCEKAQESITTGKRFLGEFYRVVFYGTGFEEQDKQAFIYKEPKLSRLAEICSRLRDLYAAHDPKLIQDTRVDESKLEAHCNYIQITKVEPYHEAGARPHTDFEAVHNVNRFVFEAPFTRSGKRHGEVDEQWRRRTILTTSHHFPYVKKRIPVQSSQDIDLSPLAVAVEEIRKKTNLLAEVTNAVPPDIKKLQLNLQGTVSVQVNEGPVVYARAFLAADKRAAHLADPRLRELESAFKDLVRASRSALYLNYNLIRSEQQEYHQSLEAGFEAMRDELSRILDAPLGLEPVQLRAQGAITLGACLEDSCA